MTPLEFIEKNVKDGDKIGDGGIEYVVIKIPVAMAEGGDTVSVYYREGVNLRHRDLSRVEWKSPSVYRLYDSFETEHTAINKTIKTDRWEIVAKYVDQKSQLEEYLSNFNPAAKHFGLGDWAKVMRDFEARIQLLEKKK